MPRGKRTPPQQRAAAAAHVLTGETAVQAAKATGLPRRTVNDIRADVIRHEKEYDYIALVSEYLAENLRSLIAQVRLFGDLEWLRGQSAEDLGVLHGIQTDKALAILSAWRQPDAEDDLAGREPIDGSVRRTD